ncbi:hypothetical protein [Actinoplanes sp. N902-109]|uniref:hypothetical protein n=1 Tax=Actinoplanes sp. (strain N902-109) TaxID=649831 RepID=UPI000329607C|nr:hypothetical protein [Actinoplanes sp. N902-109]AGL14311.1 hypothetical protein L083_0801 [Actinoplanes sp. N902-109]
MKASRYRRSGRLLLVAVALGATLAPGAALADGPGYGGTADALTVQWDADSGATDGLAVYAVGFRGGSPVHLRVGSGDDRTIAADQSGALRVLVLNPTTTTPATTDDTTVLTIAGSGSFSAGTSVLALGQTPAGDARRLVGSVPPAEAGRGVQDLAPWAVVLAALAAALLWLRRRGTLTLAAIPPSLRRPPGKRRWLARHRANSARLAAVRASRFR